MHGVRPDPSRDEHHTFRIMVRYMPDNSGLRHMIADFPTETEDSSKMLEPFFDL
jgi:hypothetical protein